MLINKLNSERHRQLSKRSHNNFGGLLVSVDASPNRAPWSGITLTEVTGWRLLCLPLIRLSKRVVHLSRVVRRLSRACLAGAGGPVPARSVWRSRPRIGASMPPRLRRREPVWSPAARVPVARLSGATGAHGSSNASRLLSAPSLIGEAHFKRRMGPAFLWGLGRCYIDRLKVARIRGWCLRPWRLGRTASPS
jgi:hypothetical protein